MRLTKEQIEDVRAFRGSSEYLYVAKATDLLDTIDALQSEIVELKAKAEGRTPQVSELETQIRTALGMDEGDNRDVVECVRNAKINVREAGKRATLYLARAHEAEAALAQLSDSLQGTRQVSEPIGVFRMAL